MRGHVSRRLMATTTSLLLQKKLMLMIPSVNSKLMSFVHQ